MPVLTAGNYLEFHEYVRQHAVQLCAGNEFTDDELAKSLGESNDTIKAIRRPSKVSSNPQSLISRYRQLKLILDFLWKHDVCVEFKVGGRVLDMTSVDLKKSLLKIMLNACKGPDVWVEKQQTYGVSSIATRLGVSTTFASLLTRHKFDELGWGTTLVAYSTSIEKIKFPPVNRVNVNVSPLLKVRVLS